MIAPDSSVVVAALLPWHVAHDAAARALAVEEPRLVAHVAYEVTSALSRMPEGHRIAPRVTLEALVRRFGDPWLQLDAGAMRESLQRAVSAGVRGGALYDALIAATATRRGIRLVSADQRARPTYEALGADVTYIGA